MPQRADALRGHPGRRARPHRERARTALLAGRDRARPGARRAGRRGDRPRAALPRPGGAERPPARAPRDEPLAGCVARRRRRAARHVGGDLGALRGPGRRGRRSPCARTPDFEEDGADGLRRTAVVERGRRRRRRPTTGCAWSRRWSPATPSKAASSRPSPGARRFGDEDVELVRVLAGQASAALANARLYRAVQEQAITDGLTGLFNHRYFYERLAQEFARAQRYGLPLSLLMLDIDDFKTFNDTHGHPAGRRRAARGRPDPRARSSAATSTSRRATAARSSPSSCPTRRATALRWSVTGSCAKWPRSTVAASVPPGRGERARGRRAHSGGDRRGAPLGRRRVHGHGQRGCGRPPLGRRRSRRARAEADKALYLAKRMGKNRVEVFDE